MFKSLFAATFGILMIGSIAFAEPCAEWERGSNYNQMYNPKTVETVKGTITEISEFQPADCEKGVLLKLESDKNVLLVHLGPTWFMNNQGIQLVIGDKVTVKGSEVDYQTGKALLAQAVVKQNSMLVLRSPSGAPAWSAWTTI